MLASVLEQNQTMTAMIVQLSSENLAQHFKLNRLMEDMKDLRSEMRAVSSVLGVKPAEGEGTVHRPVSANNSAASTGRNARERTAGVKRRRQPEGSQYDPDQPSNSGAATQVKKPRSDAVQQAPASPSDAEEPDVGASGRVTF